MRSFEDGGADVRTLHGYSVRLASAERTLIDSAALPQRIGGLQGLARVVDRGVGKVNWEVVVRLGGGLRRGRTGLRRLAAMLGALDRQVPDELARVATARPGESALFLGERRIYGAKGKRLPQWQVIVNVDPRLLREELLR